MIAYFFKNVTPVFFKHKLEDNEQHFFIAHAKPWTVRHDLPEKDTIDGWMFWEDFDIENLDKYVKVEYEDFDFYYDSSIRMEDLRKPNEQGHYQLGLCNNQAVEITPAQITPRKLSLSVSKKKVNKTDDDYLTHYGKYAYELKMLCTDKTEPHTATQEELLHLALSAVGFNYRCTPELLEAICPLSDPDLSLICQYAVGDVNEKKKVQTLDV